MNGAIELSVCLNAEAAMERVAANEFGTISRSERVGVLPDGEPEFIGSAGDGDTIDSVLAHYGLESAPSGSSIWEYYKSALLNHPGAFMKAWLHWNGSGFDMNLKCPKSTDGSMGFVSHAMPYIQQQIDGEKTMKSQETIPKALAQQLRDAASSGDLATLKRLIEDGVPVNNRSSFNNTALLYAAMHGKRDCVQFLIASGADVNIANNSGYTPLICAAKIGTAEIVQMLLDAGAEKRYALLNEDGSPSMPPRTALVLAERNHHDRVAELLGGVGAMQTA